MKHYPNQTVRELLATDAVTEPTKRALNERLQATKDYTPQFFGAAEFTILDAVCRRLIPQEAVFCAAFIDRNFSENKSDGWRYDQLPHDAETFRRGFKGLNEAAQSKFAADFVDLDEIRQNEILTDIQNGKVAGEVWQRLDAKLFFEEILVQTTEVYYAHPLAQEKIGYVGMADAPGWTRIKLNELELREPLALD